MAKLVQLMNVSCGYGKKIVLRNVSISIEEGEIVGVIGPNGSGKTTLLRAISGILRPKVGSILFGGKNLSKIPHTELAKKIAVVSQEGPHDLNMRVMDYVLLGRIPYMGPFTFFEKDEDIKIAMDCLGIMGILHLKDELVSNLSGGERQLAVISRALVQNPTLLLLDEPTSHLDIAHKVKILNILKKLNRERGLTQIVVFHDLNLASEFCGRLILLSEGEVVCDGTPNQVLTFQNLENVYRTMVIVKENPISSRPYVFPVFEEWMKR